jgi:hypothetical protein
VSEPGFFDRWGEAVVAPGRGMARADAAELGGRPGIDLAGAVVVALVVAHTRALVGSGWIAVELGPRAAVAPLVATLTAAAAVALAVVAVAAIAIWLAAGRRRDLGKDADLACVVALPPMLVAMLATAAAGFVRMPRAALGLAVAAMAARPLVAAIGVARRRGGAA